MTYADRGGAAQIQPGRTSAILGEQMNEVVFTNMGLLDPREGVVRPGLSVLIRGDTIAEVTDGAVEQSQARVVDLGGRVLMPGLIDCHVHVTAVQLNLAPT